jgi:hypothetical protein
VAPDTCAYDASKVIDGIQRPYGGPHMWSSAPSALGQEQQLELTWVDPVVARTVSLIFNDDVDEDLINLHHHRSPFPVVPELVSEYRIDCLVQGQWRTVANAKENRRRHRVHSIPGDLEVSKLRVVIEGTHGAACAQIIAIRVYEESLGLAGV